MKRLVKNVLLPGCIIFTIYMFFGCIMGLVFAGPQQGIIMSITMLIAAFLLAGLRGLWFTDDIIKSMGYSLRIFGFGVTAYIVLAVCAWAGEWFPMDELGAWASFTTIYLIILIIVCVIYQIHFKRTVGTFDAALKQYHDRMGRYRKPKD